MTISATGVPAAFTEGDGATISVLATFTDDTPSVPSGYAVSIDWGDGSPASPGVVSQAGGAYLVTAGHPYAEQTPGDAPLPVSISITETGNGNDTSSVSTTATVADAPLIPNRLTITPVESLPFNGKVGSFVDTDPGGTASDYTAMIDWGDGTVTPGAVVGAGPFDVTGSHTYATDGVYLVAVRVVDTSVPDGTSSATVIPSTAQVLESGFGLTAVPLPGGPEGTTLSGVVATFNDQGDTDPASDYTATIDWGDGTTDLGIIGGAPGNFTVSGSHAYNDEGTYSYQISVSEPEANFNFGPVSNPITITEADGLSGSPTLIAATEGTPFTGAVATFSDTLTTTPASDFTATIDWGDGTIDSGTGVTVTGSGGLFTVSGSHAYADELSGLPVIVTLNDDGPGTASASVTSTANVGEGDSLTGAPSTLSATEGNPFSGTVASFSDTLTTTPASDFTATIDWGDGTTDLGVPVSGSGGLFTVAGTHSYAEDGTYSPVVSIFDDAPGTASASVTSTANVAEDAASFVVSGVSVSGTEGAAFNGVVANFFDPGTDAASDFTATIDWGDGTTDSGASVTVLGASGSYSIVGSHTYADEGAYTVSLVVSEPGVSFSTTGSTSAAIAEGDSLTGTPTSIAAVEESAFSGIVASFSDTLTTTPASDFTATIDWGDGTTDSGVAVDGSGGLLTVSGSHTYAEDGTYSPVVSIFDDPPGTATASVTSTANITEDPATFTVTGLAASTTEGSLASVTVANFSDPGTDPASDFTATIDWGDGTTTAGVVSGSAGAYSVAGVHPYGDEQTYNISILVSEPGVGFGTSASGSVDVGEGDSLSGIPNSIVAVEGSAFSGVVAGFSDSLTTTPASDFTATIDWGDGTTDTGVPVSGSGGLFTVSGSHVYADEFSGLPIVVTLSDDAPGTATASVTSTVDVGEGDVLSASPTSIAAIEGSAFSGVVASFSDSLTTTPASDFTATIDWGDGTTDTGVSVSGAGGLFTVSGSHTYADEYSGPVIVTLSDDAPGTASVSAFSTADIGEADSLSAGAPVTFSAVEGTTLSGTVASFSDTVTTTPAADFVATIDWGDGTTDVGVVSGSGGQFTVDGSHAYAEDGLYNPVVTLSDDAPGTATASVTGTANIAEDVSSFSVTALSINPTEGTTFSGTVALFTDPGTDPASDFTASILWGDGTHSDVALVAGGKGNYSIPGSHTYAEEGNYTISVSIREQVVDYVVVANGTANVAEADTLAPSPVTTSATEGAAFSGIVASFLDAGYPGNGPSDFKATIDWGDGTTTAGAITGSSSGLGLQLDVSGTHTYWNDNVYAPVVTLSEVGQSTLSAQAFSEIDVNDPETELTVTGVSLTGGVQLPLSNVTVATFTDVNPKNDAGVPAQASDYSATIDWGDGTTTSGSISAAAGGAYHVTGTHTYHQAQQYAIEVDVNEVGEEDAYSAASTANIILGTITPSPVNFTPTEGVPYQGPVATFTDNEPGIAASNFAATINWADGTVTNGMITGPVNGPFTVSGSHVYADERAYQPVIKIGGIGSQFGSVTDNITVGEGDRLAPVATPSITAAVGNQFSGTVATFSDSYLANSGADFTASISWGDGAVTPGVVTGGSGRLVVSGTHTYAAAKIFRVQVTLNDDPPGTASATVVGSATVLRAGATPSILTNAQPSIAATFGAVVPHQSSKPAHHFDVALRHIRVKHIKHDRHHR